MAEPTLLKRWFPSIETPLICNAPMLGTANAAMATAVSQAGGFGFIGGAVDFSQGSAQVAILEAELGKAASTLTPIANGSLSAALPVGIGFLTFHPTFKEDFFPHAVGNMLHKYKPAAVWLAFPNADVSHAEHIGGLRQGGKEWGLKVFVQVGTVDAAREAAKQGAHVIVAQGVDAGGHQFARGAGVVSLVPEVKDMLASEFPGQEIAVLAAGGIVDGRGLAAAVTLGADGIVMGSRFVATTESPTPDLMKAKIVSTSDGGVTTIKSTIHDDLQGTGYWPATYDGRAIIGEAYNEHASGASVESLIEKYKAAGAAGQHSRRIVWCGTGVGLIKEVAPAGEVVKRTLEQYKAVIARVYADAPAR